GYGLIAAWDLPKPAFNAFKLLHKLGDRRIPANSDSVLATRRANGSLEVAVWNYSPPDQAGPSRQVTLKFEALSGSRVAVISRLDAEHGSLLQAYKELGSPQY